MAAIAAQAGGDAIRAIDRANIDVSYKTALDITTAADRSAHAAIAGVLRREYPHHAVLGEDGTIGDTSVEHVWYVDALDGTANFAAAFPYYCVSVALRVNPPTGEPGRTVAAAVYDPVHDELFDASEGHGAHLNGRPIWVSDVRTLGAALIVTQIKTNDPTARSRFLDEFAALTTTCGGVRVPGCRVLMLCHVAAGRFTGHCERGLDAWDLAGGSLVLTEAGGQLTDFHGDAVPLADQNDVVATNGLIHDQLLEALTPAEQRNDHAPAQGGAEAKDRATQQRRPAGRRVNTGGATAG